MSESSEWDSSRERGSRVTFSSEHSTVAVIESTSWSTNKEDTNENWSEYAKTRVVTYTNVHERETGGSEEETMFMGSAEPNHAQRVNNMVGSAIEDV